MKITNTEIMKKIYMTPEMEIVEMKVNQMLTTSSLGVGDPVGSASGAEAPEILILLDE